MVNEAFVVNDDDDGDLSSIISNVTSKILNNDNKSSVNESFNIDTNLIQTLKGKKPMLLFLFIYLFIFLFIFYFILSLIMST